MSVSPTGAFSTAGSYVLRTKDWIRCRNLIVHPNGHLYGDISGLGCREWCGEGSQLVIIDVPGRVKYTFEPETSGAWKHRAASRDPSAARPVHGTFHLTSRGPTPTMLAPRDYYLVPTRLSASKSQFEIVIAKYKEDVTWADSYAPNITIYSKYGPGDAGRYPVLPNLGREGGTYLHHIVENYDHLADCTLFLQGDPFPHPLLSISEYAVGAEPFRASSLNEQAIEWTVPWSAPAQRIDRRVMVDFLRLVECDSTIERFFWVQGAQFSVARTQIQKRPRQYYRWLLDVTQQPTITLAGAQFDNHHVAWLFELFWRNVFLDIG